MKSAFVSLSFRIATFRAGPVVRNLLSGGNAARGLPFFEPFTKGLAVLE